MTAEFWKN